MNLPRLLRRAGRWLRHLSAPPPMPAALWQGVLAQYPFLARLPAPALARLQRLARYFLAGKQFTGAHGLPVTDAMAVAVAAQACLPLLWLGRADRPETALAWYDDFVGIVLQPDDVIAPRASIDSAGVVHQYREVLAGEAMQRGPLMLSWRAVQQAASAAEDDEQSGCNVVIHECAHKMDMQSGHADGCPPLRRGLLGSHSSAHARRLWAALWEPAWQYFCEQVIAAERFGAPRPWLDAYAASAPAEFFAVACEAHFMHPERFEREFPALAACLREFFNQNNWQPAPQFGGMLLVS